MKRMKASRRNMKGWHVLHMYAFASAGTLTPAACQALGYTDSSSLEMFILHTKFSQRWEVWQHLLCCSGISDLSLPSWHLHAKHMLHSLRHHPGLAWAACTSACSIFVLTTMLSLVIQLHFVLGPSLREPDMLFKSEWICLSLNCSCAQAVSAWKCYVSRALMCLSSLPTLLEGSGNLLGLLLA